MSDTDYSQYSILVVDDIPVNILLVKGMLSKLKFNILSANSGQQALDLLARTEPDVILMDIMMPGMNGFETTRAIRANPATSHIPVIILSALNSDADIKEGLEAGANEFITKPFIQERIVNSIINQINLSAARHEKQTEDSGTRAGCDAAIRVIACMASRGNSPHARLLSDLALCLPLPLLDESLYALPKYTAEQLLAWATQRIQDMEVKNDPVSVNDCLAHVLKLMEPAGVAKGVTFKTGTLARMNVTADATLLTAVFTNLLSCVCRMASGEVLVSGSLNGGLASVVITATPGTASAIDIDFRVALALEAASRMNGAVVYEHKDNGQCLFQVLLQV